MALVDLPIRRKLMLAFLATTLLALVLTCSAFFTYEIITMRKSMVEGLRTRALIIAANSTAALAFQNESDATHVLGALAMDKRILAACLYDAQGKVFARYPGDIPDSALPLKPGVTGYRKDCLEVFSPVFRGDMNLGMVYLKSDLSALTERFQAYTWLLLGVITLVLALGLLLAQALQKQVTKPILALAETARAISRGRDYSVRAQKLSGDEIGELTDAFNRMLSEIQAQQGALRASEANYREIFEKANDAIFVHELETGRVLDVNRRAVEMTGYSREELLDPSLNISSGNPGYTQADAAQWIQKVIHEGPQVFEWQGRHKDGTIHWIEVSLGRTVIGGQERLLAFFRNISERRRLEEALASRDFIDSVLDNIPNMVFVKDAKELRFVRLNKAGEELLGFSRTDLIGKNDYDLFPKDQADFFTTKDRSVFEGGRLLDIPEESIDTKDKGKRILHTKKIPILDKEGRPQYLLGISEDITEHKRQEELRNYTKALELSNKEMQDFVFVVSHDLQEPLRKIQSFGNFLREEAAAVLSETSADYLKRMQDAARRMSLLIEDLLQLTRITTRAKPFGPVKLTEVVQEVVADLEIRLKETGGKIEVADLPTVDADPTQMRQLFQNLIANSLKFRKAEKAPIIEVKGEVDERNNHCTIRVSDNGIGFEPKYADKIFNIFQRLHGAEYEGTGIGLSICRKVVERHKGTIKATSYLGQGAVFEIVLPLRQG